MRLLLWKGHQKTPEVVVMTAIELTKEQALQASADSDVKALQRFLVQLGQEETPKALDEPAEMGSSAWTKRTVNETLDSLFRHAIENSALSSIQALLTSTVICQISDTKRRGMMASALRLAIEEDDPEIVTCLLDHGAPFNAALPDDEDEGHSVRPLTLATRFGAIEIVELLVTRGADVTACDESEGRTALHHAAWHNECELIRLLVRHGALVDAIDERHGETPLHVAIKRGHSKAVATLLECRANVHLANRLGSQPTHLARVEGQHVIVEMLQGAGGR
ncbi:hypothetical protein Poli38472_006893 [Pythium oligandrum]|uniref:Uncharacterized protein n=1 Tax=Pythium oligandrum TaxID=41045 RepID=A0A8K1C9Q0_PYTOL|nr:hypothetical protein Poli38472_006893 [Pythium oligandrum]|eukprot:TMW58748.1 hypothetical protein Poli38472_006893 [Pythium oligandrum]